MYGSSVQTASEDVAMVIPVAWHPPNLWSSAVIATILALIGTCFSGY